jgi:hypothetical protein
LTGISHDYPDPDAGWLKLRNDWARDTRLDWGALGLLAYLTSHRDGFEVELARLTSSRSSKRHKVMVWIAELEKHGYIERETRREGGVVVGTTWHLLGPNVDHQHQV